MAEQTQWEYRVKTIGGVFGTKDEHIEATLNEWGEEGWEAVSVGSRMATRAAALGSPQAIFICVSASAMSA